MASQIERILILCKTYPSPSARYAETSCVAGINQKGEMRRIYPVPFRTIRDEKQFKKWQWVEARVERSRNDNRPESYKIYVDTIKCDDKPLATSDGWRERRAWLDKIPQFESFDAAEQARQRHGLTLVLVRPSRVIALEIRKTGSPIWTEEEKQKLLQLQNQGELFDETDSRTLRLLKKLPYDFHYRYECDAATGKSAHRHKIVDWEAGALFWNVRRRHGDHWEKPFRAKLEQDLPAKDLMFLLGTMHRFPDQWLIVSLIYPPPRPRLEEPRQQSLPLP